MRFANGGSGCRCAQTVINHRFQPEVARSGLFPQKASEGSSQSPCLCFCRWTTMGSGSATAVADDVASAFARPSRSAPCDRLLGSGDQCTARPAPTRQNPNLHSPLLPTKRGGLFGPRNRDLARRYARRRPLQHLCSERQVPTPSFTVEEQRNTHTHTHTHTHTTQQCKQETILNRRKRKKHDNPQQRHTPQEREREHWSFSLRWLPLDPHPSPPPPQDMHRYTDIT